MEHSIWHIMLASENCTVNHKLKYPKNMLKKYLRTVEIHTVAANRNNKNVTPVSES